MGYEIKQVVGTDPFRYGVLRKIGNANAPTLVFLGGSIEDMLLSSSNYDLAYLLIFANPSWNIISLDLPCHGEWTFPGVSQGLAGWRQLADANVDFMALTTDRVSRMLAHAASIGVTDLTKVATAGISRGGFVSFHCVQAGVIDHAAAISPVVKLTALSEFNGFAGPEPMPLSPAALAATGFHLTISDSDTRVSTAVSAQFCADAIAQGGIVEQHITLPSISGVGHSQIVGEPKEAAQWILRRFGFAPLA